MKIGGYQIIDLGNKSLTTTAVTIDGIYELIEGTRKTILLTGVNIGAVEKHDLFAEVNVSSDDFVIHAYGGTITITDDDEVTYTEDEE